MKFGLQKKIGVLFLVVSSLGSSGAFAEGPGWSAPKPPAGPLVSKDACDAFKSYAEIDIQSGQAGRDYVDNQYVFYKSVAQKIHDKLADGLVYLNQKYKKQLAAVHEGLLDKGKVNAIQEQIAGDLHSAFFDKGYQFCPAGSEAYTVPETEGNYSFRTCKPTASWKQVNNNPPYGVSAQKISFQFSTDDHNKPVPVFSIDYNVQDSRNDQGSVFTYKVGKTEYKSAAADKDISKDYSLDPNQFSTDKILQDIWPYRGVPGMSPRPETLLKEALTEKHCQIYEPDYKPNTTVHAKVVDERVAPSSSKTSGTTSGSAGGQQ